jgi:starch synthase (maltosyl-transferring)
MSNLQPLGPILTAPPELDCAAPRLVIDAIAPAIDQGKFPVRRTLGETVTVTADIFSDGHGKLAADAGQ